MPVWSLVAERETVQKVVFGQKYIWGQPSRMKHRCVFSGRAAAMMTFERLNQRLGSGF